MTEPAIRDRADFERVVVLARERAAKLVAAAPDWPLANGVARQLEFIADALGRRTAPSQTDAERIVLGVQAVRNFEGSDDELYEWLTEIDSAFRRWAADPDLFR
jgi:Tsi6